MPISLVTNAALPSIPLHVVTTKGYARWLKDQPAPLNAWLTAIRFKAEAEKYVLLPDAAGHLSGVLAIVSEEPTLWALAHLPGVLPEWTYHIIGDFSGKELTQFTLGWQLGSYEFSRYRKTPKAFAQLKAHKKCNADEVRDMAESYALVRDLINTPTEDMAPQHLSAAARQMAGELGAAFSEIVGDELLTKNYPTIHAVGRASVNAPRLIELNWGDAENPKVTLVGKGVCFDSGGLDIKTASGMQLMKKDMGGAALMLGLARLIILNKLPVRLRVLIPAVENSIAGNAFRPGDVIRTRKGITVEIGNTDAEGRLILCDALAEADSEKPDLLIDAATLTGAARVALGPELPVYFTPSSKLAKKFFDQGEAEADPVWRLPLWKPYREYINSKIADINNAGDSPFAGSITAALYLQEFVETKRWIHLDTMAWNPGAKPGRPAGGEALALRALFAMVADEYGGK